MEWKRTAMAPQAAMTEVLEIRCRGDQCQGKERLAIRRSLTVLAGRAAGSKFVRAHGVFREIP